MSNSVILRRALDEGDLAELSRLLAEDSTIAGRTHAWGFPCQIGPCQAISYLAQARFNGFVKHRRAGEMTRMLLEAGAPVDGDPTDNETLLITAASYNEVSVARMLIDGGANLEAIGQAVFNGTPLAHAIEFGAVEIVDLLVASGARIRSFAEAAGAGRIEGKLESNADSSERAAALRAAAVCDRLQVIDELHAAGISLSQLINGGTALHWAAWEAKATAARHLVSLDADVAAKDPEHGGTAPDWARHRSSECPNAHPGGHADVIRFLESTLRA
jgi:ankyrin repeat protein